MQCKDEREAVLACYRANRGATAGDLVFACQPNVVELAAWSNPDCRVIVIGLSRHRHELTAPNIDFVDLEPLVEATRRDGISTWSHFGAAPG